MRKEFSTPYSRAWAKFRATPECDRTVQEWAKRYNAQPKYIENGIRNMFDAGWNAKTSSILDSLNVTLRPKAEAVGSPSHPTATEDDSE